MRFPLGLFLFGLPLVEIAGFVVVGRAVGVLGTIGLVIASGIVGAVLMRIQGFGLIDRIRGELAAGRTPAREVVHGVMVLVAGILLLIPGFVTDIIGLLLFIPAVRDLGWRFLRGRLGGSVRFASFGFARPRPAGPPVIDLDSEDYRRDPESHSPWRRIRKD